MMIAAIVIIMAIMVIMAVYPPRLDVHMSGSVCLIQSAAPAHSASRTARTAWLRALEQRRLMERALELAAARSAAVYHRRGEARGNIVRLANGGYLWGSMDVTGPVEVTVVRV